jgi:site-specific recombinase XerD
MSANITFSMLLETFFTGWLLQQKCVSPHTIASYRDTFCLLLRYAQKQLHKGPENLSLSELNASMIVAFLDYLQQERGTSARSRNVRLAAIHSFFRYAALQDPCHSGVIEQVLAIPSMRYVRHPIEFLTHDEIEVLLTSIDQKTWFGRRDRTLLLLAVQTGLRVSELIGLYWKDIFLGTGAHVCCLGKGRKSRCTPLRKDTVTALRSWKHEQENLSETPVFPNMRGLQLSRDGVAYILAKYVAIAGKDCPSMQQKRISPHVLRHSAAMELLQSGVDCAVIALWLGHESMDTTQIYLHASLKIKEQALDKTKTTNGKPGRYKPGDTLMTFLKGL